MRAKSDSKSFSMEKNNKKERGECCDRWKPNWHLTFQSFKELVIHFFDLFKLMALIRHVLTEYNKSY